jgi:hypothetical protein
MSIGKSFFLENRLANEGFKQDDQDMNWPWNDMIPGKIK